MRARSICAITSSGFGSSVPAGEDMSDSYRAHVPNVGIPTDSARSRRAMSSHQSAHCLSKATRIDSVPRSEAVLSETVGAVAAGRC